MGYKILSLEKKKFKIFFKGSCKNTDGSYICENCTDNFSGKYCHKEEKDCAPGESGPDCRKNVLKKNGVPVVNNAGLFMMTQNFGQARVIDMDGKQQIQGAYRKHFLTKIFASVSYRGPHRLGVLIYRGNF